MGILRLENEGKEFKLNQSRMVIGRRPGVDIVLADPAVSGRHILIISILDDSFLENLSDTNGTFINGNRTEKAVLQEGDVIKLGNSKLIYHVNHTGPGVDEEDFEKTMILKPGEIARNVATESQAKAMQDAEDTAAAKAIEPEPESRVALLKVRSGPAAGKEVKVNRSMVTLGRPGVQVVVVSRRKKGYFISFISGASGSGKAPAVNGRELKSQSTPLADGDVISLAGVEIEFVL
ncbi:MAG: hypothetical protein BMS9Abin25_1219 [Gammaproteobacteria bacterium]|nr:MAG: hypothetical protein BMS9Abin25_1219 [Gammaproteobacteria bacterium]